MKEIKFELSEDFMSKYKNKQPNWGPIGYIVYKRTYARLLENGKSEEYSDTIKRVVEGAFNIQKNHCRINKIPFNQWKAQASAQKMFQLMWDFKFTPPGRGLWTMGTNIITEKGSACMQNCAFISTKNIDVDFAEPFCFMMDMSMLGVGVGGDTKGVGKITIREPKIGEPHIVEDTREGWTTLLRRVLNSYVKNDTYPISIDYSFIRKKGAPLVTMGGIAPGSEPLKECISKLTEILNVQIDKKIDSELIVDIFNIVGKCVVSGGIRRTAQIMLGEPEDNVYLNLKNPDINKEKLYDYRWTSNNSIFAQVGMDYSKIAEKTAKNGEPGYVWLDNIQKYSRMDGVIDNKDYRASGTNPCCFSGDTFIAVADGRGAVPIEELAKSGNDIPVYSISPTGTVEIQWARAPQKTGTDVKTLKILFDNGKTLQVTPDHKFMLNDGTTKKAENLIAGDSLPRFTKDLRKLGNQQYLSVATTPSEPKSTNKFEHRLIAKFINPDKYEDLYNTNKVNGWIKGGVVIHHKDYNGLNNDINNLEIMTFKDHCKLHGSADNNGSHNPMFGKMHSSETKKDIGKKSKLNWKNNKKMMIEEIKNGMNNECVRAKIRKNVRQQNKKYYLDQEKHTNLNTVWIGDKLYADLTCEICEKRMVVPWRKRNTSFCSLSCKNKSPYNIQLRTIGLRKTFDKQQKILFHDRIKLYKELQTKLDRPPYLKEFQIECKKNNISFRINKKSHNQYIAKTYKEFKQQVNDYNHVVVSVEHVKKEHDVYNLTVETNHTVGVVLDYNNVNKTCDGIFTYQSEQSLESGETCNLVETYPSNHDTLEEWLDTLKYAYMYAKTVTLIPTHNELTNSIMMRNRRIGCSMSGITQAFTKFGRRKLLDTASIGYDKIQHWDKIYSDWLCVPRSIKTTSVKPSGCFIPETKVKTTDGVKTLTEIFSENDIDLGEKGEEYRQWYVPTKEIKVLDENNEEKKITNLFVNGYEKTLKLTFDDDTTIECTPNHKFKLKNGSWKEAKDLDESDNIEAY